MTQTVRIAIVTGAGTGIGKAAALALSPSGVVMPLKNCAPYWMPTP